MRYDDNTLWMDQPVQQWQANAGEGEGDDVGGDAGSGAEVPEGESGDSAAAGAGAEGDSTEDPHAALQAAIDAGIDEADGKPPAAATDEGDGKEGEGDGSGEGAGEGEEPEGKGEGEGEDPNKAKGPDPVNDPIPDEVKGRTRERMESLVSRVKEIDSELSEVRGNFDEMMGIIQETGATPEQYGMLLQYVGAFNQGVEVDDQGNARVVDQQAAEQALQALEGEREILYRALGREMPGHDPLAEHQDLKDFVETGDLTEDHAKEIAEARWLKQQAAQPRRQQPRQQDDQAAQQQEQAIGLARENLNAIGATLKATDPHYEHKIRQIMPKVKELLPKTDPSKWVDLFRDEYAKAKAPAKRPTGPQPLRGKQPAGGQKKAATSLEEAIDMGIDQASGR